jgi:hypothetical protein
MAALPADRGMTAAARSDHYCTYFDHRYAALGLAMMRSVRAHGGTGPIWVLCLDDVAEKMVANFDLGDVRIVPLATLEQHFAGLAAAKSNRSPIEYIFTMAPHILSYVLDTDDTAERVAYLDGDLFFFGPVRTVWEEMGDAPVGIIAHDFHRRARHLERYGAYNVGWVSFDRSVQGRLCLDFWAAGCRDWCYDKPHPDGVRFADQGYLTRFHEFAPDLKVIAHKGCNVGPWNVDRHPIRLDGGEVRVGGDPLIFFHFTGFKKGPFGRWFNAHRNYRAGTSRVVRDHVYRPFLTALLAARATIAPMMPPADPAAKGRSRGRGSLKAQAYRAIETGFRLLDLATGNALREPRR